MAQAAMFGPARMNPAGSDRFRSLDSPAVRALPVMIGPGDDMDVGKKLGDVPGILIRFAAVRRQFGSEWFAVRCHPGFYSGGGA